MAEAARNIEAEDEAGQEERSAGRGMWSGTLSFGLVSIPVSLHSAIRNTRVALHVLDPKGSPVARRYACSADDKLLDWDEIVRGYEVSRGKFVVVTDDELAGLAPEKSRDIDLKSFVKLDEVDRMLFERAYYLSPGGGASTKAYRLLAETMAESRVAGIATFVMREREYLVAILSDSGVLRVETLRFADQLRTPHQVGLAETHKTERADARAVAKAIDSLAAPALDMKSLADEREQQLIRLITKKDEERHDVVTARGKAGGEVETVVDLMERLRKAMSEPRRGSHRAGAAKAAPRRSASSAKARSGRRKSSAA